MQYLILVETPEEVRKHVVELRKEYGFRERVLDAHITIVPPFISPWPENQLIQKISEIPFTPFKLSADGFDFFQGRNCVIFLNLVHNQYLEKLYLNCRDILEKEAWKAYGRPELFGKTFSPHIMVEKRMRREEFVKVWPKLKKEQFKFSWMVKEFWMYSCDDDGQWKRLKSFGSGSKK